MSRSRQEVHPNLKQTQQTPDEVYQLHPYVPSLNLDSSPKHSAESSTARIEYELSASVKDEKSKVKEGTGVQVPTFAIINNQTVVNPIRVGIYGNVEPAKEFFRTGCSATVKKKCDVLELQGRIKYEIYYSVENIHPNFILYFPDKILSLESLQSFRSRNFLQISYVDLEDAELFQMYLTPSTSLSKVQNITKCDPKVACKTLIFLFTQLRMKCLAPEQGVQVTAEPAPSRLKCCS